MGGGGEKKEPLCTLEKVLRGGERGKADLFEKKNRRKKKPLGNHNP